MAPKLYFIDASPPVRGTLLTIKALGIDVELIPVNLMTGEHLTPEYLKMNPQHTVPTLKDGDFVVWDSHAINAYLVGKYGKDDSLYPKNLEKRATIDQRMYFDCGVLFARVGAIVAPIIKEGVKTIPKEKQEALVQAYDTLETFLDGKEYIAGNQLSIADFSTVAVLTTADVVAPLPPNKLPNVRRWLSKMQALPYYKEANQVGLDKFSMIIKSKLA